MDFIWVASSELTEFIFKNQHFSKPFFTTYFKCSLFMLYLPGFLLYRPWRDQCQFSMTIRLSRNTATTYGSYRVVAGADSESERSGPDDHEDESEVEGEVGGGSSNRAGRRLSRSLSEPSFQPVAGLGIGSSGTDSEPDNDGKKVRFSRVAEVREMSAREALHANLARLSYAASLRAAAAIRRAADRLGVLETAQLALTFSFLFFMGNYSYQAALASTEAGIVNVLSASSCVFTLLLAALFPATPTDTPTLTKLCSVSFTMCGVILVSYSDLKLEDGLPRGALWALVGALCYSAYIVFLRRKIDTEDKLDVPMFFGFVGLFIFLSLWPFFLLLHYSEYESFQWPGRYQWLAMTVNGLVGTVLSELLWLFGCFYTSSLVATLAISLTIPLTMLADVLVKEVVYDRLFYLGAVPMFLAFFIVALLTHWDNWDPIRDALVAAWRWGRGCCCCRRTPGSNNFSSGSNSSSTAVSSSRNNGSSTAGRQLSCGDDPDVEEDERAALMESEASPAVYTATQAETITTSA